MTSSSGAGEALSLQPQENSPPTISSEVDPGLESAPGATQCPMSTRHLQEPLLLCIRRERLSGGKDFRACDHCGKVPFVLSDTAYILGHLASAVSCGVSCTQVKLPTPLQPPPHPSAIRNVPVSGRKPRAGVASSMALSGHLVRE